MSVAISRVVDSPRVSIIVFNQGSLASLAHLHRHYVVVVCRGSQLVVQVANLGNLRQEGGLGLLVEPQRLEFLF